MTGSTNITARPRTKLISHLLRVIRRPSGDLRLVCKYWGKAIAPLNKERKLIQSRIKLNDPVHHACDLLSPLRSGNDEVLHTLALAFLLDPCKPHGLGHATLRRVLLKLYRLSKDHRSTVKTILHMLRARSSRVLVIPERRHLLSYPKSPRLARTDIWIEIESGENRALLVIENKVHAKESDGQLVQYERVAKTWCRNNAVATPPLLVFLTPHGHIPMSGSLDAWQCLSYAELASALRRTWQKTNHRAGNEWLRLYVATLLRQILGIRVDQQGSTKLGVLRTYLAKTK